MPLSRWILAEILALGKLPGDGQPVNARKAEDVNRETTRNANEPRIEDEDEDEHDGQEPGALTLTTDHAAQRCYTCCNHPEAPGQHMKPCGSNTPAASSPPPRRPRRAAHYGRLLARRRCTAWATCTPSTGPRRCCSPGPSPAAARPS